MAWSFQPSGPFAGVDAGDLQGRIYRESGHIELAGPDLAGHALANVVRLAPPAIQMAQGSASIGALVSSRPIAGGLELKQALGSAVITSQLTFPHEGVLRYEVLDWGTSAPVATAVAAPSTHDEHVYGFGEKFNAFDQSGQSVRILTFDEPGTKRDRSYKVAPWFVSTRGYGLHLDTTAESVFDMGATTADRYVIAHRFPTLRLNLVYGPGLTRVLTRFTGYTGRASLPPPWAFGPWISSDIWRSGGEVRYAVTQFRARGLPASAFVFDSPWETAYNDFTFNMTQFGRDATIDGTHFPGFTSLAEMMTFLQHNGLKVICWMAPFVNVASSAEAVPGQNLGKASNYDEAAAQGFFVRVSAGGAPLVVPWWKGQGSPVDFTSAGARGWLTSQLRTLVAWSNVPTRSGRTEPAIGGFKTDDGESGNGPNTYIPLTGHYADGRTGVEMRNAYCLEYQKTVATVLGGAGILFARSGFVGSQAFPGCWAGDNEPNFGDNGLPSVVTAAQSAAMSGYAIWGHDVGGYQDTNVSGSPAHLFMRWTQFGCFSPLMQMHRQVTREHQYPWRYGPEALDNFRVFARLHTRLFPYLYTYAREASTTGVPIIRPLVLLHQTDPRTFGLAHTYFFGNEFLVAPMITNATARQVYLPAGQWIEFWTNARHAGGQTIDWTSAKQAEFPLFVRDGAIVPMLATDVQTLCDADYVNNPEVATWDGGLMVLVYPRDASRFTLYDETDIRCQVGAAGTVVTFTGAARSVMLRFLSRAPAGVTRDGVAMPRRGTAAELDATNAGWRAEAEPPLLFVKFPHGGGVTTIQF